MENVPKNISYLTARDPSIISWNRCDWKGTKLNLDAETSKNKSIIKDQISEYDDKHINVFLRLNGGSQSAQRGRDLYRIEGNSLICRIPEGSYKARNVKPGVIMTKTYTFSKIFGPTAKQIEIFNSIIKVKILEFLNGRNSTLFTYGASGSGKTFTIVGTSEEPGIVPRTLEYIFRTLSLKSERPLVKPLPNGEIVKLNQSSIHFENTQKTELLSAITNFGQTVHAKTYEQMQQRLSSEPVAEVDDLSEVSVSMWVSFAEIYNENIVDLLKPLPRNRTSRPKLRLGMSNGETYIKDLSSINVQDGLEAYQILQYGLHNLNYAATALNNHSSRSHGIFSIKLVQTSRRNGETRISCFNFCDLAGSERSKKTLNTGERLKESNNINKSLLVLGRCIQNLRLLQQQQQLKDNFLLPFRESKLTQLFQNALMGQKNIAMIVNINPSGKMIDESHHALHFAALTRQVSIEEKPARVIKPKNRFSDMMEQKCRSPAQLPDIEEKEDERDLEIERLRKTVADLYNEIENITELYESEIMVEKTAVSEMYKKYIDDRFKREEEQKEKEIAMLKEEYEEKLMDLRNRYERPLRGSSSPTCCGEGDVINISSSSEESFRENEGTCENDTPSGDLLRKIEELELENARLIAERTALQNKLSALKSDDQRITQLEKQLTELTEQAARDKELLEDAEKCYEELTQDRDSHKARADKFMMKYAELKDDYDQMIIVSFGGRGSHTDSGQSSDEEEDAGKAPHGNVCTFVGLSDTFQIASGSSTIKNISETSDVKCSFVKDDLSVDASGSSAIKNISETS